MGILDEYSADESPEPGEPLESERSQSTKPTLSVSNAPAELLKTFWTLVLLFNVAIFALSIGALLIGFRGRWLLGGGFLAVGAIALARGLYSYRAYRARND